MSNINNVAINDTQNKGTVSISNISEIKNNIEIKKTVNNVVKNVTEIIKSLDNILSEINKTKEKDYESDFLPVDVKYINENWISFITREIRSNVSRKVLKQPNFSENLLVRKIQENYYTHTIYFTKYDDFILTLFIHENEIPLFENQINEYFINFTNLLEACQTKTREEILQTQDAEIEKMIKKECEIFKWGYVKKSEAFHYFLQNHYEIKPESWYQYKRDPKDFCQYDNIAFCYNNQYLITLDNPMCFDYKEYVTFINNTLKSYKLYSFFKDNSIGKSHISKKYKFLNETRITDIDDYGNLIDYDRVLIEYIEQLIYLSVLFTDSLASGNHVILFGHYWGFRHTICFMVKVLNNPFYRKTKNFIRLISSQLINNSVFLDHEYFYVLITTLKYIALRIKGFLDIELLNEILNQRNKKQYFPFRIYSFPNINILEYLNQILFINSNFDESLTCIELITRINGGKKLTRITEYDREKLRGDIKIQIHMLRDSGSKSYYPRNGTAALKININ